MTKINYTAWRQNTFVFLLSRSTIDDKRCQSYWATMSEIILHWVNQAWRQSINEHATRLKYGPHAVHLVASIEAPAIRECPIMDDLTIHSQYAYEHIVPVLDPRSSSNLTTRFIRPLNNMWTNLLSSRVIFTKSFNKIVHVDKFVKIVRSMLVVTRVRTIGHSIEL